MSSELSHHHHHQQQQQQQQQQPRVASGAGPTIWQIYFDDDEGEEVKVKVDPAAMVDPHRDDDDDDDEEAEVMTSDIGKDRHHNGRSNVQTHQPSTMKDTKIHIHKTGLSNVRLCSTPITKDSSSIAIGFGTFESLSVPDKRIPNRSDSDQELLLPTGSSRVESWKKSTVASCCSCSGLSSWKKLLWTTALAVCIAVVYAVVMAAVVKGIGGY